MGMMVFKLLGLYHSKQGSSSSKKQNPTVIEELCHRFSLIDIRKSTNNFDESRLIESRGYCKVYRGCLEYNIAATDCTVPVKQTIAVVKQMFYSYNTLEMFKNEIELLCQLNHPNIISLRGFCSMRITLSSFWTKAHNHSYLNPSHILLDCNMVPKLTCVGDSLRGSRLMSKSKSIQITNEMLGAGVIPYGAYECLLDGTFSDKSDVYAFGIILLQVLCAREPFEIFGGTSVEEKMDPILNGKIEPRCWEKYLSTAKRCLKVDPNERPTMGELEVELEQADTRDNHAYYTLLSNTSVNLWDE